MKREPKGATRSYNSFHQPFSKLPKKYFRANYGEHYAVNCDLLEFPWEPGAAPSELFQNYICKSTSMILLLDFSISSEVTGRMKMYFSVNEKF